MTQLFSKASDSVLRFALLGGVIGLGIVVTSMLVLARSPFMTRQGVVHDQTVPFSHQHHVRDIGIDCRYCHQSVEVSAVAGVPTTDVCLKCHRQLWNQSAMLEPVRASGRTHQPLSWRRVHDLPDYVYFNHSIHLKKGVGCYSCHGAVGEMPLTYQDQPLTMQWCLECHRNPTPNLRPEAFLYEPHSLEQLVDAASLPSLQKELAERHQVKSRVNCWTCHR